MQSGAGVHCRLHHLHGPRGTSRRRAGTYYATVLALFGPDHSDDQCHNAQASTGDWTSAVRPAPTIARYRCCLRHACSIGASRLSVHACAAALLLSHSICWLSPHGHRHWLEYCHSMSPQHMCDCFGFLHSMPACAQPGWKWRIHARRPFPSLTAPGEPQWNTRQPWRCGERKGVAMWTWTLPLSCRWRTRLACGRLGRGACARSFWATQALLPWQRSRLPGSGMSWVSAFCHSHGARHACGLHRHDMHQQWSSKRQDL